MGSLSRMTRFWPRPMISPLCAYGNLTAGGGLLRFGDRVAHGVVIGDAIAHRIGAEATAGAPSDVYAGLRRPLAVAIGSNVG